MKPNKLILMQRTIALFIILTLIVGVIIFYYLDHPKVEVRYIDRIITNERIVTVKEYEEIEWYFFEATGYSANDPLQETTDITAIGKKVKEGMIAVDPDVIPLGTKVEIKNMGIYIADDTGGLIKRNKIDIYFDSKREAKEFGRRNVWLRILEEELPMGE